jgi:hypothetical protein
LTSRIAHVDEYLSALVHLLASSTFAVIFGTSALSNAIIVTFRFRDQPRSFRFGRYYLGQIIVVVLALAWLACLIVGNPAEEVEFWIGVALALASFYVFIAILQRDPSSTMARRVRLTGKRDARSPLARRRLRLAKIFIPVAILAAAAGAVAILESVAVVHEKCRIQEYGNFDGEYSMTTSCGRFAVQSDRKSRRAASEAFYAARAATITTRGYVFGFPPEGMIIRISTADYSTR